MIFLTVVITFSPSTVSIFRTPIWCLSLRMPTHISHLKENNKIITCLI